ncbi:hypothetical protein FACS189418_6910 [Clostridia bacterium]|nr:hypothetical protein FACS189418_6910 [Clostridia bacterium]
MKCDTARFPVIGVKKLDPFTEVDFSVFREVGSCITKKTKDYYALFLPGVSDTVTYNAFRKPDDFFNCVRFGCSNTGTLFLTNQDTGASTLGASYEILSDATSFSSGVVTFYFYASVAGDHNITFTIADITDKAFNNADVYQLTVNTPVSNTYAPAQVNLFTPPDSVLGSGWGITSRGAMIKVESTTPAGSTIGLSSIALYESLADFEVENVVKLRCLDSNSGNMTVDASSSTCFGATYDETTISIERTLTGKQVTPNYWLLNPLLKRGEKTIASLPKTTERVIESLTLDGIAYGVINLEDMNEEECGEISVSLSDSCNVAESQLFKLNAVIADILEENQYFLDKEEKRLLFHSFLVGEKVIVSYPQKVEVEHFRGTDEALNETKVKMKYTFMASDGTKYIVEMNNVLVTSFPNNLSSTDETTFEFTISVQRDEEGNFFHLYRVKE